MLPVDIGNIIKSNDEIAVLIAPEGTRKLVKSWKRGFYFIAEYAEVPIFLCYLDWEPKKVELVAAFIQWRLRERFSHYTRLYRGMKGKHIDQFNL